MMKETATGFKMRCVLCVAAAAVLGVPGLVLAAQDPATPKAPSPGAWLAKPSQTEPKILEWARNRPELVSLDAQQTLGGHTAYAVTVTDPSVDEKSKKRLVFSQPHANEPAATAGMMDFLAQLLDGRRLDGRPSDLDRTTILRRAVLTFIPDGNPDGRARSPEDWWDGQKHSNEQNGLA
jgi:murein tripeptide amidase MpaA